jgi:hypothetical protein
VPENTKERLEWARKAINTAMLYIHDGRPYADIQTPGGDFVCLELCVTAAYIDEGGES